MFHCENLMNDHRKIRIGSDADPYKRKFRAIDAYNIHKSNLKFIEDIIQNNLSKTCVVITHHAPTHLSVSPAYQNNMANPAYHSNLSEFIFKNSPKLWIHGHMHDSCEYNVGDTKVICNPKGYAISLLADGTEVSQNVNFVKNFVISDY